MNSLRKEGPHNLRQRINEPALLGSSRWWLIMKNLHAKRRKPYSTGINDWPSHNHSSPLKIALQMAKKTALWFGALGAGILAFGLIVAFLPKQPSYAGRPLSFWIDQLPARLVMTNGSSEALPACYATLAEAQTDQA